jgi:hypothetical protein
VHLDHPVLPAFLDAATLRNLALGEDRLHLEVRRAGSEVASHVLRRSGDVKVVVTT